MVLPRGYPSDGLQHLRATQRPQLQRRTGRTHAARRHPPRRGSTLWLQGRRLRLMQVQEAFGHRSGTARTRKGAERRGRSRRLRADLLRCRADRRGAGVASGGRGRRFSDQEDARPRGGNRKALARRDGRQAAIARQRAHAIPGRPVHRVHPARRRAAQLQHGQRAAHADADCGRQHGSAGGGPAHPPHARRQVQRPCLFNHGGKGNPARGRTARQLLPARGLDRTHHPAGFRALVLRPSRR